MSLTPLRERVLRVFGLDPHKKPENELEARFCNMIARFDAPAFALHVPAAVQTWEVQTTLLAGERETARIPQRFPSTALIVGFRPVVQLATWNPDPAANPDADDIDVLYDINDGTTKLSSQQSLGVSAGKGFVTLGSIGVLAPRLMMLMLDGLNPEVGFTFRSKFASPIAAAPANGFGADIKIDVSIFLTGIGF